MSSEMTDLTEVIEDSLSDATLPDEPIEEPTTTEEPVETTSTASETVEEPETSEQVEVTPAATKEVAEAPKPVADDFEKRFGISPTSPTGRENRIPYSRVQKIVGKAQKDAQDLIRKEFEPKVTQYESQVTEYTEKIKDYETRLAQVADFENVMLNDQARFLTMLAGLPQYTNILAPLFQQPAQVQQTPPQETAPAQTSDDMPQPDQDLADGSKVYSQEGLRKLLAWNAKQAADMATKRVEERYAPIETQFQAHQRVQAIIPQVQKQIEEARQWPQFNENEADIVKALQADQQLTLEGAYRQVVFPKLATDRNRVREEVLKEIKQAPRSTSTATAAAVKSKPAVSDGPRTLEDVIAESIKDLK